jgi:hypothetical protein
MYKFIIYDTKEEALVKAEEEGKAVGLPWWENPHWKMKYVSYPFITADSKWALDVTQYTTLTSEEESQTVEEVNI